VVATPVRCPLRELLILRIFDVRAQKMLGQLKEIIAMAKNARELRHSNELIPPKTVARTL